MTNTIPMELYWLLLTLLLTATLWVPYILQLIVQLGPIQAMWDPNGTHPHNQDWALRAKRAHYNAIENLAVFAPLVILIALLEASTPTTVFAAKAYFFLRAAHYVIHLFGIPVIRTMLFVLGFACQMVLGFTLLGAFA